LAQFHGRLLLQAPIEHGVIVDGEVDGQAGIGRVLEPGDAAVGGGEVLVAGIALSPVNIGRLL